MSQKTFTIEEIRNYLCFQCDMEDVYNNLSEDNILKANYPTSQDANDTFDMMNRIDEYGYCHLCDKHKDECLCQE